MLLTLDDAIQHVTTGGEIGSLTPAERRLIAEAQQMLDSDKPRQHREGKSRADKRRAGEMTRAMDREWGSIPNHGRRRD